MTLAEIKNRKELKGKHVEIRWRHQRMDWPYYVLLDVNDDGTLWLQGADYPDGSASHDGGIFWAMADEAKDARAVSPNA